MFLSTNALVSDPSPLLDRAVGGLDCPCRAEWEAFCNKTAAARAGNPCISCARACDTLLVMRVSAALDSFMHAAIPSNPFTFGWLWTRGNGPNHSDFARLWAVMPWSVPTGIYSWVPLGRTVWTAENISGYQMTGLTEGRAAWDRTPRWSLPYYLPVLQAVTISVGVPVWSEHGEFLGGVSVDVPMTYTHDFFLNLSLSSPIPFMGVLSLGSGELVAAATEAIAELWGECPDNLCDVMALDPRMRSIAESENSRAAEYWDIRARGTDYIVFVQTLSTGWKLWFFVLRSDAFPCKAGEAGVIAASVVVSVCVISAAFAVVLVAHSRRLQRQLRELERQLGSMASASVIGTPAEDAIRALIRVQQSRKLPRKLRADVSHVMTLIATNKLFKADADLREKLHDMKLEKDVGSFLLSVLAEKDQLRHLSSRDLAAAVPPGSKRDLLRGIETCEACDSAELEDPLALVSSGDREREEGLTVSPFMDRQTADTAKCQLAFIKFIVRPMSELVHHISPGVSRDMLANIDANAAKWSNNGL
eukprot:m51a1_g4848 putative high affinity cgmp-specific 3 -cyclic phosphodiesterase 9a (533) ;mRNA; r:254400-258344